MKWKWFRLGFLILKNMQCIWKAELFEWFNLRFSLCGWNMTWIFFDTILRFIQFSVLWMFCTDPFSTGPDTCHGSVWWGLRQWPFTGFVSVQRSTANLTDYLGLSGEGLHRCLEEWQGPWVGLPLTVVTFVNIPGSLWYSSLSWASSECPCCFWLALLSCLVKQTRRLH